MKYPCGKQRVIATLRTRGGRYYTAENWRASNRQCPRQEMPTGTGYEHCVECGQTGHAEVNALKLAGENAVGGTMTIVGHTYACLACQDAMDKAGVARLVFE